MGVHQKLHKVLTMLDTDGGGTISKNEFVKILENGEAVRCLQDVGVDVIGLVDFADFIFENDESEDAGGDGVELDFPKFVDLVLQLRGSNNATVKDIVDLRKFVQNQFDLQRRNINEDLRAMQERLGISRSSSVRRTMRHQSTKDAINKMDSKDRSANPSSRLTVGSQSPTGTRSSSYGYQVS